MRIGIDLHALHNLMQGSRTYIYALVRHLLELDTDNDYVLYLPPHVDVSRDPVFVRPRVHLQPVPGASRYTRLTVGFFQRLLRDRIDVFHCQYVGPLLCPCPFVVTIHDVIHEVYPEFYPGTLRRMMHLLYPFSARRAGGVITGSEFSRREISRLYHVPLSGIDVTPYAAAPEFQKMEDRAAIAARVRKYGIEGPYILFVGRIEPRKNIPCLIGAYRRLRAERKVEQSLVIAGMKDPLFEDYHRELLTANKESGILFTGGVEQEDMPHLLGGADLFVYPSFAEGFGLPVLEAMACGTPVIASHAASLPEVVGNSGRLFDPADPDALVAALREVLANATLRGQMGLAGLRQAAGFSWRRTAEQTLAVYRRVWEGSRRG